jgi:TPR repeat protein
MRRTCSSVVWVFAVLLVACEPSGSTNEPAGGARLNAPDDADAEYPPTCSELGPSTCSGPCQRDDAASCLHLAEGNVAGVDLPRDPERGLGLMRKSCNLGFARACGYLAMALGRQDPLRAKELGRKSCDGGYGGACVWYVGHHVVAGVPPNWREGAPLLEHGCKSGHAYACLVWGDLLRTGSGTNRDPAGATAAYAKACDAGESRGCDLAKGVPEGVPVAHELASDNPTHDDVRAADVRGEFRIEVDFCVTTDGTPQVRGVTGAPGKLEGVIHSMIEEWRFTPTGATEPLCTKVLLQYSIE